MVEIAPGTTVQIVQPGLVVPLGVVKGDKGDTGATGSTGPTGATGPQGLPGPGSAAWTAAQAVTTGSVRQAPDGSWIKSTASRTTGSTFDATEQGFWTPVATTAGTMEQAGLAATFVPHGTSRGKAWIDVNTDYTGAADASADINAAYVAAEALGLGVRLRQGVLKVTSAIVPKSGVALVGAGMHATVLKPVGAINCFERQATSGAPLTDVTFADFEIDGSAQTNGGSGYSAGVGKGIFMTYMRRATYRNLYIHDTIATGLGVDNLTGVIENVRTENCGRGNDGTQPGGSGIGIGVGLLDANFEELTIANCHAVSNKRYGVFLESQGSALPSGMAIIGCSARGNKDGFGECGTTGAKFTGNSAYANTRAGFAVDSGTFSAGAPGIYSHIYGNSSRGNLYGILVYNDETTESIDGTRIFDNLVHGNSSDGIRVMSKLAPGAGTVCRRVRISRNDIHSNGAHGINLRYSTEDGTAGITFRRFTIDRNRCWNNTGYGIRSNVVTDHLRLLDNECWDDGTGTQTVGILFNSGGTFTQTDLEISGNDLTGNATALTMPADANLAGTTIVRRNKGYNPRGAIARTPGASPWTYTCVKGDEILYITGGTGVTVTKNGIGLGGNATGIPLEPGESVVIGYTAAPTVNADRK